MSESESQPPTSEPVAGSHGDPTPRATDPTAGDGANPLTSSSPDGSSKATVASRCALLFGTLVFVLGMGLLLRGLFGEGRSLTQDNPAPSLVAPSPYAKGLSLAVQVTDLESSPLQGAELLLYLARDDERYQPLPVTITDADGEALVGELLPGRYWLIATAPKRQRVSTFFRLRADDTAKVRLAKAHTLRVTVTNQEDEPIGKATVLVRDGDALPFGAATQSDGVALFKRLSQVPYALEVFARGYESRRLSDISDDLQVRLRRSSGLRVSVATSAGEPAEGATVEIVGSSLWPGRRAITGAEGHVRVTGLLPGYFDLRAQRGVELSVVKSVYIEGGGGLKTVSLRLATGRSLRVRVVDASDEARTPLAGVQLSVTENGLSAFPTYATTDDDGRAELGPLARGPLLVDAHKLEFTSRVATYVKADDPEVEIELLPAGTLTGAVTDADGRPVQGATLEVIGTGTDGLPLLESPTLSDAQLVHFAAASEPLQLLPRGELGVTVGAIPNVNAALGGPALSPLEAKPETVDWGTPRGTWRSGLDGSFSLNPVSPGRIRVLARHPDHIEGVSESVLLTAGGFASVNLVMTRGVPLAGRVLDTRGFPVGGARVKVQGTKSRYSRGVLASEDGNFAFEGVPTEVLVSLAPPEEPTLFVWRKRVAVKPNMALQLTLPERRESVRVQVLTPEGLPVDLAQVTVASLVAEVPLKRSFFTAPTGEVELPNTVGLNARVSVLVPGYLPLVRSFKALPPQLELKLEVGIPVAGRVTAVRGRREVSNARVVVSNGQVRKVTQTDGRGRFLLPNVPLGSAEFRVKHPDYADFVQVKKVEPTARTDRAFELPDFELSERSDLSGVVRDKGGIPAAFAWVSPSRIPAFVPLGKVPANVVVADEQGRFEIAESGARKVTLYAAHSVEGRGTADFDLSTGSQSASLDIVLTRPPPDDRYSHLAQVALTLGEHVGEGGLQVVIVQVADASEAMRGGLRANDVIEQVDGIDVRSLREAREVLSGPDGTDLLVRIRRGEVTKTLRVLRERVRVAGAR